MYIHFAFGQNARDGNLDLQSENLINFILKERKLKFSICEEFIPSISGPDLYDVDLGDAKIGENGGIEIVIDTHKLKNETTIRYRSYDVPMICFIDVAFNKLKSTNHCNEYGKLGLVFTNEFYKRNALKNVYYYDELSLEKDKLVTLYNKLRDTKLNKIIIDSELKKNGYSSIDELEKTIIKYRKPRILTKNFERSTRLHAKVTEDGMTLEKFTYDRYPVGYNFTNEREARITTGEVEGFLNFDEKDLYMVISPNKEISQKLENFILSHWSHKPIMKIFPT